MTADNITAERASNLWAELQVAERSLARLVYEVQMATIDPAEAAAIVNETIQNLTNEAR